MLACSPRRHWPGAARTTARRASSTDTTTEEETTTTAETETTTTTEAAKPTVVSIVVVNGAPKGGIVRETVDKGDRVVLVVKSDVADEIHLHGYDIIARRHRRRNGEAAVHRDAPGPIRGRARGARRADRGPDRQRMIILAHGIGGVRDLPVPESFFFTTRRSSSSSRSSCSDCCGNGRCSRRTPTDGAFRQCSAPSSSRLLCGSSSSWSRSRSSS